MPELIERYLAELERRLPGRRGLRRRAIAEASRHLHDAFADEQAAGLDEQAAEQRAIERFGPARDVADAFRASLPVRHVTTRRVAALVTAGLAAALIATIVQETSTPDSPRAPQAEAAAPASPQAAAGAAEVASGGRSDRGSGQAQPAPAAAGGAAGDDEAVWTFSSWDAGAPGERASEEVQQRFRRRAARSVDPLPKGTPVRRVLARTVDGVRYEVFGVRVRDLVCIELRRPGWRIAFGCATLAGLEADPSRWVLVPDMVSGPAVGDGTAPRVTLGFVPDGADPVALVRSDGRVGAAVSGNVFLVVAASPKRRSSARRLVVRAGNKTVKVPVRTPDRAHPVRSDEVAFGGPTRVERFPTDGTIGWLRRGERRGGSIPSAYLPEAIGGGVFRPDALSADAVVVFRRAIPPRFPLPLDHLTESYDNADLCVGLAEQGQQMTGAICGNRPRTPFIGFVSVAGSMSGHATTFGLVTDDVARLEAYAGPDPIEVPIVDNIALVRLPAWPRRGFPFKLVAYDADGQVIGIVPDQPDFGTSPQRPDETQRHIVVDLTDAAGIAARLDAAPSNQGGTCWWLTLGSRTTTGCVPREPHRQTPGWPGIGSQWTRNGPRFVFGAPAAPIDSLALRLADGTETSIPIVEGLALALLPAGVDAKGDAEVVGRDTAGNEIAHVDAFTGEILLREPATPPIQAATGRGIQLRVYQDPFSDRALLALDTRQAEPAVRAVLTPRREPTNLHTSVMCYRAGDDGITTGHGVVADADTLAVVGMPLRTPLDACELPGSNGKAWRDRWNGRSVVEFPLTERGRRYLAERDTARDLGLFLRTPAMRAIRAQRGKTPAAAEIAARYPAGTVMALARRDETLPAGVVGIWTSGTRVTVVEQSPAGTRYVADLNQGRIVGGNLRQPIRIPQGETAASPRRTSAAIPGPALLLSRAGPGRSWRLSDGSVVFTSRQRIQSLDRPGVETTLPLASLGALAPDATRVAVVDGDLKLRLLDPATLATTAAIPLGPTVSGPTVRQPRRDTSTWVELLPWRAPDAIAVVVARVGPRSRLDRRELLLVDPASGTVRARADVTRYRALLATATTTQAVLLLMRDRRGSNPYVLVRITYGGQLDTVELPQRLVGGTPGSLPVDPAGNRAFTIGRKGRIGEIDLTSLAVREHDLKTDIFHPWTFATPNDVGTVGDGALPVIARYPDGSYRPALVDTHAWRLTSFLTDAEPQGPASEPDQVALVGGFSGLCGSCGAGLTAYATDGTPRWHALGTRLVANTQSASSVTLVVLNHATRTGARLFLLDTRTGRPLAQLPATRYPGWVQLLAP